MRNRGQERWKHRVRGEIVLLDNRDSFVFNLLHRLVEVGAHRLAVARSDEYSLEELISWEPRAIIVSPGPGHPSDAGISEESIRHFHGKIPILGICLGHQAIITAFGGNVEAVHEPQHGKASPVFHDGQGVFEGLSDPFDAGRYHSLSATTIPEGWIRSAWTADSIPMGVRHESEPTIGLQFHPESILTPRGFTVLKNFLALV